MNSKRSGAASPAPEDDQERAPGPEPQSDPNPAWFALEAEAAARSEDAVRNAKRSDSDVRAANAHLDPEEVS